MMVRLLTHICATRPLRVKKFLIPVWTSYHIFYKVRDENTIHPQTSTVALLKFVNRWIPQMHTALYLACGYLSILGLKINHVTTRAQNITITISFVEFGINFQKQHHPSILTLILFFIIFFMNTIHYIYTFNLHLSLVLILYEYHRAFRSDSIAWGVQLQSSF